MVWAYLCSWLALYSEVIQQGFLLVTGLTHLPLDKMAAILADNIFNCIFLNENDRIPIQISLKYFSQESNWQ